MGPSAGKDANVSASACPTAVLSFEHEGLPSNGVFLSFRKAWLPAVVSSGNQYALRCDRSVRGAAEEFRWHPDATLQHVPSGLWLYADDSNSFELVLHPKEKTKWEVEGTC